MIPIYDTEEQENDIHDIFSEDTSINYSNTLINFYPIYNIKEQEHNEFRNYNNEVNLSNNNLEHYERIFTQTSAEKDDQNTSPYTLIRTEENNNKNLFEVNNMEIYTYEKIIYIFEKNNISDDIIKRIEKTDLKQNEQQIQIVLVLNTKIKKKNF